MNSVSRLNKNLNSKTSLLFEDGHLRTGRWEIIHTGKNKRSLIPDFRSTCSAVVDFVARQLLPEERANELPRTMERSQQAEQPVQDRKDNSERLLLFVSTDNGAVMTGNIYRQWERGFHAARKEWRDRIMQAGCRTLQLTIK